MVKQRECSTADVWRRRLFNQMDGIERAMRGSIRAPWLVNECSSWYSTWYYRTYLFTLLLQKREKKKNELFS